MGSLNADKVAQDIIDSYDVIGKVQKELKARGIEMFSKPSFNNCDGVDLNESGEPIIPEDITRLNMAILGRLYSMVHSYFSFLNTQLSLIDLEYVIWEEIKEAVWSTIRSEFDDKAKAKDKDDWCRIDKRYIRVNSEYMIKRAQYEVIKGKHKHFEMAARAISREISRRDIEFQQSRSMGGMSSGRRNSGIPGPS